MTPSPFKESSFPDLHDLLDRLPADRTRLYLFCALHTGAYVAAVKEQGIHTLPIADLTHLTLLVRDLPIGGALTPALALLIAPHVFVASSLLNKHTLTVPLIVGPAARVRITVRVCARALGMFFARPSTAGQEWTCVRVAGWGNVSPQPGVEALEEIAGVVVWPEGRDGDVAGMSLDRVFTSGKPEIA